MHSEDLNNIYCVYQKLGTIRGRIFIMTIVAFLLFFLWKYLVNDSPKAASQGPAFVSVVRVRR